jgi:carbamoyl-phosphate synthase large subunit
MACPDAMSAGVYRMGDVANVMVAGIGGASLGTEILKSLRDAGRYRIFGCDVSGFAYGHYEQGLADTFIVSRKRYVGSVLDLCIAKGIQVLIPGGEEPLVLLGPAAGDFLKSGVHIAANSPEVIATCSDKRCFFERMQMLELPTPWTVSIQERSELANLKNPPCPCIIKPSTGTGGSRFVFMALNQSEIALYVEHLLCNGLTALVQEYIGLDEGEFTVGILSLPDGRLAGSIAMQRLFNAKLSVLVSTKAGLISSGNSQGLIDEFPGVRAQAEKIAWALHSVGPMNVQGRVRDGILIPFEVNPRFSASTYLRAMAGFNEVDMYLQYVLYGTDPQVGPIRPGYYMRSFAEQYVPKEAIKQ